MFKCLECGIEYEIKPEYCDCGNDTFEEINPQSQNHIPTNQKVDSHKEKETKITNFNPLPQIQKQSIKVKSVDTINEINSENYRSKTSVDTISLTIFSLCVILAFITLFYIGTPPKQANKQVTQTKTTEQPTITIPSVDSFWDNSIIGVQSDNTKEIEVEIENSASPQTETNLPQYDPIAAKFEEWLNKPKKTEEQYSIQKPIQQTQAINKISQPTTNQSSKSTSNTTKPANKNTTVNSVTKPVNQPQQPQGAYPNDLLARIQKNISNNNTQPSATTSKTAIQQSSSGTNNTTVTTSLPSTTKQTTTPLTQSSQQNTVKPELRNANYQQVKTSAELNQELTTYKISLRNSIGKKINFANVVGDGSCAITFKIDSSGKLINRAFSKQSTNITLNDAVFSAMKSTSSYNPPPEAYKSETLTLSVKIYAGNYEISLN